MGDFGCVLGGQATKSTVCVRPKDIFCVHFGQEGHLPTQHPGFGSKLSSKGKPGTCALLETLQSPVSFVFRLHIFVNIDGFFTLGETRDEQLSKECCKTFL